MHYPYLRGILIGVLLFAVHTSLSAQLISPVRIHYDPQTAEFSLSNLPELVDFIGDKDLPTWGSPMWEFGDGHYAFGETPTHHYSERGNYRVTVHLIPRYAVNDPFSYSQQIEAPGKRAPEPIYDLGKRRVLLESNNNDAITPGQTVNYALNYSNREWASNIQNGYLFFFYNKKNELPKSASFRIFDQPKVRHTGEDQSVTPTEAYHVIQNELTGAIQNAAQKYLGQYESVYCFRVTDMGPEEQRRVFISLASNQLLEKYQDKNRTLHLTALFVPNSGGFNPSEHTFDVELQLLAIHDPNRIRVDQPVAYFHRRATRTLDYTIDFQNKAKGFVEDVRLEIFLDKGLDSNSVKITSVEPALDSCPANYPGDVLRCYEMDTRLGNWRDQLILSMHNLGLGGRRGIGLFANRKDTKGKVKFSIETEGKRTAVTSVFTDIVFGEVAPVRTNRATTRWRRRSLFLQPKYELDLTGGPFYFDAQETIDRLGFSVAVLDAPLRRGLMYGASVGYTSLTFSRSEVQLIDGPNSNTVQNLEQTRLRLAEAQAQIGYQFFGALRATTGVGVSLPVHGETDLRAQIWSSDLDEFVDVNSNTLEYGLLGRNNDTPDDIRNSLGFSWHLALEVGLLDRVSFGLAQDVRYFPKLYLDECGHFRTYSVFARFRIDDMKR